MSVSVAVSLSMESVSSGFAFFRDHVEREALGDLFEDALRLLGLFEQLGDLRKCGDLDAQLLVEQQRQLVDEVEVARIGERDIERPVLRLHRHEVVPEHQIHGNRPEQIVIDGRLRADPRTRTGTAPRSPAPAPPLRRVRHPDLVNRRHSSFDLAPYLIVSAKEKIGRYNEINTNATKIPSRS